jgi:rsbT co-antagonist protein RsbR
MTSFLSMFEEHQVAISDVVAKRIIAANPYYATLAPDELSQRVAVGLLAYARDLDEPTPYHFAEYWSTAAYLRAQQGIPLPSFLETLLIGSEELLRGLRAATDDLQVQITVLERGFIITANGIAAVYAGYTRFKDEIIETQQNTIAEVSLPVVPVHTGILVMPLVGTIDASRAAQIMERVLYGVSEHQADILLLDITGVPLVDTNIAQHLIQVTRAAQLIGTTVIMVGIRSDIAQTIVGLGVDLTNIVTLANLQAGIAYALAAQGLAISPLGQGA